VKLVSKALHLYEYTGTYKYEYNLMYSCYIIIYFMYCTLVLVQVHVSLHSTVPVQYFNDLYRYNIKYQVTVPGTVQYLVLRNPRSVGTGTYLVRGSSNAYELRHRCRTWYLFVGSRMN
jgi:hypothetical protein